MFVRKLLYPLFNIISIRYIHTNHPSCYLSQKYIRNYINKGCLEIWDIYNISYTHDNLYNIYTLEHIWPKSFLKNHLLSKHDLHNLGITSGFCNVHRSNYKYSETSTNMVSIQINDNNNIFGLTIIFIINI
jgi:endonuclease I